MELNEFVEAFAGQFDDTDASEITATCEFHNLDEWSSLMGMTTIAFAKTQYGKTITGAEIKSCITVEDLFHLIDQKN